MVMLPRRFDRRDRIYPVPLKPRSGIRTWAGWPDDVRDLIRDWNKRCGLSFYNVGVFKCADCEKFCEPDTTAVFRRREYLCDDCLIIRARAGYKPPERTEIEVDAYRGGGLMYRRSAEG